MILKDADDYFKSLSKEIDTPLVIVLTGGIAASILADERTTDDIDFAILKFHKALLPKIEASINALARKRGILVQYSTDIDRWSMISLLDWRKHSRPYRKMAHLEVRVLDPYYWTIGKVSRWEQKDQDDLRAMIRKQNLDWKKMAGLWAKALVKSPPSTEISNVRRQMEIFLKESRKGVFSGEYDPVAAVEWFKGRLAGLTSKRRT